MNVTIETPVKLTAGAVNEVKRLMNEPGFDASALLRIGVKGGGCSGLSYVLGFDKPTDNDNEYNTDGVRLVIDKAHELYLAGMQVDWENGFKQPRVFVYKSKRVKYLRLRDQFCCVTSPPPQRKFIRRTSPSPKEKLNHHLRLSLS